MISLSVAPNVLLKELLTTDAEALFALVDQNREYLREWLPWLDHSCSVEDSLKFILDASQKWEQRKGLILGIWFDANLIGTISFNTIDQLKQTAGIGYWISRQYQGKGIITQACRKLLDYGFKECNLEAATISCAEYNQKSQAIPVRLGFDFLKTEQGKEWLYDHYVNHTIYVMSHTRWKSLTHAESPRHLDAKGVQI